MNFWRRMTGRIEDPMKIEMYFLDFFGISVIKFWDKMSIILMINENLR